MLLVGAAFTLVGWAAWSDAAFPRWVAGWIAVAGAVTLVRGFLHEFGFPLIPPLLLTNNVLGIGGLHVALVVAFWGGPVGLLARRTTMARASAPASGATAG